MNCPRCGVPLTQNRIDAAGLDLEAANCAECTGHWLALDDLRAAEKVVDVRLLKWLHLPGKETQGRILFCPRCTGHKAMDKVVSTRDQRVVMDVCSACKGVWLDRGELEAIQRKGLLSSLADILRFLREG